MTKQSLKLSTVLGTGALCAALVATPITASLISGSAYALDSYTTGLCTSNVLTSLGTNLDELNALVVSDDNLKDATSSAKTLADYNKYATVFNKESALGQEVNVDADADAKKAAAEELLATIRNAGFTLDIDESSLTEQTQVSTAFYQAYPEANDYATVYLAIAPYDGRYHGEMPGDFTSQEKFAQIICSAAKIDPNFKVNYATSTNPFDQFLGGIGNPATGNNTGNTDNTGDNTTSTTQPTTIESENKDVKVSGINININYTLNVNLIPATDLKLTGNDFKNSTNQAFYDIFIQDDNGDTIKNTGEVSVSIKLPSTMNINSDFVVYYVPMAMNGEYLTDQAEAIKGVKVSTDGWLTFTTNHFSVYGIVEYPKNKAPNTGVVAQNENSATTAGAKVFAGIMTALTTAGAAIVARRQILRKAQAKKN